MPIDLHKWRCVQKLMYKLPHAYRFVTDSCEMTSSAKNSVYRTNKNIGHGVYHNLVCNFIKLHVQKLKLQAFWTSKKSKNIAISMSYYLGLKPPNLEKGSANGVQTLLSLTKGTGV